MILSLTDVNSMMLGGFNDINSLMLEGILWYYDDSIT